MALPEERDHIFSFPGLQSSLILTLPDIVQLCTSIPEVARLFLELSSPKDAVRLVSASIFLNDAHRQTETQNADSLAGGTGTPSAD